jgi:IS30 family transposase
MARHLEITVAAELPVYFCDPASPWQRGSNENTNGLLRQYFPKGEDLSIYPKRYLDFVSDEMNQRPRKTLGWDTPAEALAKLLSAPPDGRVATTG